MKSRHLRVLKDIQDSIPKELIDNLTHKEKQFPTLRTVLEASLKEPDSVVSPEKKRRYRAILDSGVIDKEAEVIDQSVEKQIDAYMSAEIDKAVKLGRLPRKAETIQLLNNKGKQYERRQRARLKALADGLDPDAALDAAEGAADEDAHTRRQTDGSILPVS